MGRGQGLNEPADPGAGTWFDPIADHLGAAYLRYSFTKGTEQEAAFLVDLLGLAPDSLVLDAGCGPGRHLAALGRRGVGAVGLDRSMRFCRLARADGAAVVRADVRRIPFGARFDAVICLCQGGFGLLGGDGDEAAFGALAACLRPGGRLVVSAFSSYFQVRHQEGADARFDPDRGVMHERTEVRDESGTPVATELWTTGFTPRELRLLARSAGLEPEHVWSVEPGRFARRPPEVDLAEFLLVARRT